MLTRIPIAVFYGIGIYALCLTSNIYTVSAIRTIALFRAARGVGFILTLVTFFLIYDAISSIRASIILTSLAVALVSFPLFMQGFWGVILEKKFSKGIFLISAISSLVMGGNSN